MKMWRLAAAAASALVCLAASRTAHAQLADAVYSDVKDVIEELLTAEVAESVVPELACQAGRTRLPLPAGTPDPSDPARCDDQKLPDDQKHPELCDPRDVIQFEAQKDGKPEQQRFRLLTLQHFPRSLQRVYSRQFGALRTSITEEAADFAGYVVYQTLLSAAARLGDQAAAAKRQARATGRRPPEKPISTAELPALPAKIAGSERLNDGNAWYVQLKEATNQICVSKVRARFKAGLFETRNVAPLDEACGKSRLPPEQAYACESAFAVRAALVGKADAAQEHLIHVIAWVVSEAVVKKLNLDGDRAAKAREIVLVTVRDVVTNFGASPADFVAQLARDLHEAICAGESDAICAQGAIAARLKELNAVVAHLRVQWSLLSSKGTQKVDVASFAISLMGAGSALNALCADAHGMLFDTGVCRTYRSTQAVLTQGRALWQVLRAAGQGDTHEAVHLAVSAMFHQGPSPDPKNEIYRRFAESIALYVIDSAGGNAPNANTRGAFKSAALDVIRSVSGPSGFSRMFYTPLYIPSFALRASWNPAYVNHDDSSFRYMASVNVLGIRPLIRYTNLTYVALDISLLDLVAPLSELALRDNRNADYDHKGRVAFNLISPRVDLLLGIPALSQHLAVGIGGSLRMVAPVRQSREVIDGVTFARYDYQWFAGSDGDVGRFFEFGFFAKYLL